MHTCRVCDWPNFHRFGIRSKMNILYRHMVQAFIGFVPVISCSPPVGMIALGIAFYVFDIFLREPVAK